MRGPVISVSGLAEAEIQKAKNKTPGAHIIDAFLFLTNLTEFRYDAEIQKAKFELLFPPANKGPDTADKANPILLPPNANRLKAIDTAAVYRSYIN